MDPSRIATLTAFFVPIAGVALCSVGAVFFAISLGVDPGKPTA